MKNMIKHISCVLLLASATTSRAGVYSDDLGKCLVSSTSANDRALLVRWMFTAASTHPAIKDLAIVTPEQLAQSNMDLANLFMELLTEKCRDFARNAARFEGQLAIQQSFQLLGQVAGQELFTEPSVIEGMSGIHQHVDMSKLESMMKED